MDTYRFFNSKDVAGYLRKIGYEFNAFEAAYIVDSCDDATLDEKIAAWNEVIETMPDCPLLKNHDFDDSWSTHRYLREYIDLQKSMLARFRENEGCVYFLHELRRAEWPDYYPARKDGDSLWIDDYPHPFSTFEGCVDHLKKEQEDGGDGFDRYVISKAKVDFVGEPYEYRENEIVLDGSFRPLRVSVEVLIHHELNLANQLLWTFLKFPVPFARGDIVIDRTARNPHPFVFDCLKFWNSAELIAHGCDALSEEEAAKLDKRVAGKDERGSWDDSYMAATGYELASLCVSVLTDPCDLVYDIFGACDNYLNLEYYREPLEGNQGILGVASRFMRGEIGADVFLNCTNVASIARQQRSLESAYDSEYTPEVRHLYKGGGL